MFDKEAEEYANGKGHEHYNYLFEENAGSPADFARWCFQDGAEFGYNKAIEWHYVNWKYFADKDYPESECVSYLVQLRNKDTLICEWETEEGFGYFYDSNLEPIDNDDVYAWKEIVLPKEIEK
jgi:hypothetical protein